MKKNNYLDNAVSTKITPEINEMLNFVQSKTLMSKSAILRYGIKKVYEEFMN